MRAKKTVLIAEDDADDVFLLQRAFSKAGINANLQFASDGEEAIRYLLSADQQENPIPDLLLLDLKMPKLTGFDVLTWLQEHPGLAAKIPVVVLTGSIHPADMRRAKELGAVGFEIVIVGMFVTGTWGRAAAATTGTPGSVALAAIELAKTVIA